MLKVLEAVSNYLNGVKDTLQQQVEMLRAQWEEAQERLSAAENALSACEASQKWDEEDGEYHPSCRSEEARVERARRYEQECREKLKQGERIVRDVQSEIEKYKAPGGPIIPPGAEKYLEYLAKDHTQKAIDALNKVIEVVEEYLRFGVTMDRPGAGQVTIKGDDNSGDNKGLTPQQKKAAFEAGAKKVVENNRTAIESSTRVMVCERCGRPLTLCICPRILEREYPY